MRIFIFEYSTGGGLWRSDWPSASGALLKEGRAMVQAITADFCELPNVEVCTTRDSRLPPLHAAGCQVTTIGSHHEQRQVFQRLSREADWTLLIAPETGGELAGLCQIVETVGGRLPSPSSEVVAIATDKQATAELLASHGVPVPRGMLVSSSRQPPANAAYPAVVKPVDGCGSQGVRLILVPSELASLNGRPERLEEFVPGLAASVALLCGPAGQHSLPACQQLLSGDGRFNYLGGRLPLSFQLDQRARRLAEAAVSALPQPRGYIGVDLVLGSAEDGSGDRVIEINPRLTTSYVGLRAFAQANLAAAMLAVAVGESPDLRFKSEPIEFAADGTIAS